MNAEDIPWNKPNGCCSQCSAPLNEYMVGGYRLHDGTFAVSATRGNDAMKIGANKLKMSSGEVKTFGSQKKRDNFERVAQAYKRGWKPKGKRKK